MLVCLEMKMFLRDIQMKRNLQKSQTYLPNAHSLPLSASALPLLCITGKENVLCTVFTNSWFKVNVFSPAELDAAVWRLMQGGAGAVLTLTLQVLLQFVRAMAPLSVELQGLISSTWLRNAGCFIGKRESLFLHAFLQSQCYCREFDCYWFFSDKSSFK